VEGVACGQKRFVMSHWFSKIGQAKVFLWTMLASGGCSVPREANYVFAGPRVRCCGAIYARSGNVVTCDPRDLMAGRHTQCTIVVMSFGNGWISMERCVSKAARVLSYARQRSGTAKIGPYQKM